MSIAASALLFLVHLIYRLVSSIQHAWRAVVRRRLRLDTVAPTLSKLPRHVALTLVHERKTASPGVRASMIESTRRVVRWCEELQIPELSIYDRHGIILSCINDLCDELDADRLELHASPEHARDQLEHPLTPPPSDHSGSDSRPWSPEPSRDSVVTLTLGSTAHVNSSTERGLRKRRPKSAPFSTPSGIKLHVLSRDAGKPQLAAAARALAEKHAASSRPHAKSCGPEDPTVAELDELIHEMTGLSEVDLMVVHRMTGSSNRPLEMHGFPPWQTRLAEIYHDAPRPFSFEEWWPGKARPLTEDAFCRALSEFGRAEQRVGK